MTSLTGRRLLSRAWPLLLAVAAAACGRRVAVAPATGLDASAPDRGPAAADGATEALPPGSGPMAVAGATHVRIRPGHDNAGPSCGAARDGVVAVAFTERGALRLGASAEPRLDHRSFAVSAPLGPETGPCRMVASPAGFVLAAQLGVGGDFAPGSADVTVGTYTVRTAAPGGAAAVSAPSLSSPSRLAGPADVGAFDVAAASGAIHVARSLRTGASGTREIFYDVLTSTTATSRVIDSCAVAAIPRLAIDGSDTPALVYTCAHETTIDLVLARVAGGAVTRAVLSSAPYTPDAAPLILAVAPAAFTAGAPVAGGGWLVAWGMDPADYAIHLVRAGADGSGVTTLSTSFRGGRPFGIVPTAAGFLLGTVMVYREEDTPPPVTLLCPFAAGGVPGACGGHAMRAATFIAGRNPPTLLFGSPVAPLGVVGLFTAATTDDGGLDIAENYDEGFPQPPDAEAVVGPDRLLPERLACDDGGCTVWGATGMLMRSAPGGTMSSRFAFWRVAAPSGADAGAAAPAVDEVPTDVVSAPVPAERPPASFALSDAGWAGGPLGVVQPASPRGVSMLRVLPTGGGAAAWSQSWTWTPGRLPAWLFGEGDAAYRAFTVGTAEALVSPSGVATRSVTTAPAQLLAPGAIVRCGARYAATEYSATTPEWLWVYDPARGGGFERRASLADDRAAALGGCTGDGAAAVLVGRDPDKTLVVRRQPLDGGAAERWRLGGPAAPSPTLVLSGPRSFEHTAGMVDGALALFVPPAPDTVETARLQLVLIDTAGPPSLFSLPLPPDVNIIQAAAAALRSTRAAVRLAWTDGDTGDAYLSTWTLPTSN